MVTYYWIWCASMEGGEGGIRTCEGVFWTPLTDFQPVALSCLASSPPPHQLAMRSIIL